MLQRSISVNVFELRKTNKKQAGQNDINRKISEHTNNKYHDRDCSNLLDKVMQACYHVFSLSLSSPNADILQLCQKVLKQLLLK